MKLHQLPNGSWITLSLVTAIDAVKAGPLYEGGPERANSVIVHCGDRYDVINRGDFTEACRLRDELADLVNASSK